MGWSLATIRNKDIIFITDCFDNLCITGDYYRGSVYPETAIFLSSYTVNHSIFSSKIRNRYFSDQHKIGFLFYEHLHKRGLYMCFCACFITSCYIVMWHCNDGIMEQKRRQSLTIFPVYLTYLTSFLLQINFCDIF